MDDEALELARLWVDEWLADGLGRELWTSDDVVDRLLDLRAILTAV